MKKNYKNSTISVKQCDVVNGGNLIINNGSC